MMTATTQTPNDIGRLLVRGQDRPGIVSGVSTLLSDLGANIVSLDQYSTDPESGRFFQRTEFHMPNLGARIDELRLALGDKLGSLDLDWELVEAKRRKRVAIFVSKIDHCLLDLLWRHRRGDFNMDISMVISNHPDLSEDVRQFNIPYIHVPVAKVDKASAEQRHLELLKDKVELVVLARYMQILSSDFLDQVGVPVINIHHSFLPAFIGAGPYQKAKDRGVKLIGATAHYVTEDLDEGPIIEQDVIRVTHANTAAELMQRGADVERLVLSKAVAWHCEDRILRDGNTTVIFRK
jgi:formyltetrahydrofolate deformylase